MIANGISNKKVSESVLIQNYPMYILTSYTDTTVLHPNTK